MVYTYGYVDVRTRVRIMVEWSEMKLVRSEKFKEQKQTKNDKR